MNILSIQSHVAYGFVGNRAATFPLQRLGFDVWAVNTVQFSNHTGYGAWKGEVFSPEHVRSVIDGIDERGALRRCDALLTGYLGDPALGEVVMETAARVRAASAGAIWACDPVMGDVGRGFFVRPGLPELFRDRLVPAADVITPNQFELEHLAGGKVGTLAQAIDAARSVIARGTRHVLVTSLQRTDADPGRIEMLAVGASDAYLVSTPLLAFETPPNGSGDAVAALFLGHYLRSRDIASALGEAAAAIFAIMAATSAAGERELALIAAQAEFAAPSAHFPVATVG